MLMVMLILMVMVKMRTEELPSNDHLHNEGEAAVVKGLH